MSSSTGTLASYGPWTFRCEASRARLDWYLDLPFFSTRPPEPLFDLVPRRVMENPRVHPVHARRIREADLDFALHVIEHEGRVCILDGMHRLAKAVGEGRRSVAVRWVERGEFEGEVAAL